MKDVIENLGKVLSLLDGKLPVEKVKAAVIYNRNRINDLNIEQETLKKQKEELTPKTHNPKLGSAYIQLGLATDDYEILRKEVESENTKNEKKIKELTALRDSTSKIIMKIEESIKQLKDLKYSENDFDINTRIEIDKVALKNAQARLAEYDEQIKELEVASGALNKQLSNQKTKVEALKEFVNNPDSYINDPKYLTVVEEIKKVKEELDQLNDEAEILSNHPALLVDQIKNLIKVEDYEGALTLFGKLEQLVLNAPDIQVVMDMNTTEMKTLKEELEAEKANINEKMEEGSIKIEGTDFTEKSVELKDDFDSICRELTSSENNNINLMTELKNKCKAFLTELDTKYGEVLDEIEKYSDNSEVVMAKEIEAEHIRNKRAITIITIQELNELLAIAETNFKNYNEKYKSYEELTKNLPNNQTYLGEIVYPFDLEKLGQRINEINNKLELIDKILKIGNVNDLFSETKEIIESNDKVEIEELEFNKEIDPITVTKIGPEFNIFETVSNEKDTLFPKDSVFEEFSTPSYTNKENLSPDINEVLSFDNINISDYKETDNKLESINTSDENILNKENNNELPPFDNYPINNGNLESVYTDDSVQNYSATSIKEEPKYMAKSVSNTMQAEILTIPTNSDQEMTNDDAKASSPDARKLTDIEQLIKTPKTNTHEKRMVA